MKVHNLVRALAGALLFGLGVAAGQLAQTANRLTAARGTEAHKPDGRAWHGSHCFGG